MTGPARELHIFKAIAGGGLVKVEGSNYDLIDAVSLTDYQALQERLAKVESEAQSLANACKTCVGFEPFYGLEPHRLSEAIERWNKFKASYPK